MNVAYLCYMIFAPGHVYDDAITCVCLCASEKEKDVWVADMIANAESENLVVAKIENKKNRWLLLDDYGLHAELVCIPAENITFKL